MRKVLVVLFPLAIGISLFIGILGFAGLQNIASAFRQFSLLYLGAYLAAAFMVYVLSSYKWRLILEAQGHKVRLPRLMTYRLASFSIGYLTPFARLGGEPIRAYMLKKHKVNSTHAFSSVFIDKTVETVIDAILIVFIIVLLLATFTIPSATREILMIGMLLIAALLFVFYYVSSKQGILTTLMHLIPKKKVFRKVKLKLVDIDKATQHFFDNKKECLGKIIIVSIFQWAVIFTEFKLATMIIGYDASMTEILLMILATGLSTLIPVPAGLGVLEASQFSLFELLGIGGGMGIALSLLIRFKDLLLMLFGLMFLSHEGINFFRYVKRKVLAGK